MKIFEIREFRKTTLLSALDFFLDFSKFCILCYKVYSGKYLCNIHLRSFLINNYIIFIRYTSEITGYKLNAMTSAKLSDSIQLAWHALL